MKKLRKLYRLAAELGRAYGVPFDTVSADVSIGMHEQHSYSCALHWGGECAVGSSYAYHTIEEALDQLESDIRQSGFTKLVTA